MTHLKFQVALVEGLVVGHTEIRRNAGHPILGPEPARLTERHFVDDIPEKKHICRSGLKRVNAGFCIRI